MIVCLLTALLITGTLSEKLTKTENAQIQQICGTGMKQQKVMNGWKAESSDAPWAVPINVLRTDGAMHCSGTLVSPRHVITARHCFINDFDNGESTYVYDGSPIDKTNCQGNDYWMPHGKESAEVHFSTKCRSEKACEDAHLTPNLVTRHSIRVFLPGVCAHESSDLFDHDDFAIVELDKDVLFSESILPACIPKSNVGLTPGTNLTTFGFGFDPADKSLPTGVLRYESGQVKRCDMKDYICTMSYTGNQLACRGDSGAGSVLSVNNRITLIAVLSRGEECHTSRKWYPDYLAPVVKYEEKICEHTGICAIKSPKSEQDVAHLYGAEKPVMKKKSVNEKIPLYLPVFVVLFCFF